MRRKTQSSKSLNKQIHEAIEAQSFLGIFTIITVIAVLIIIAAGFINGVGVVWNLFF